MCLLDFPVCYSWLLYACLDLPHNHRPGGPNMPFEYPVPVGRVDRAKKLCCRHVGCRGIRPADLNSFRPPKSPRPWTPAHARCVGGFWVGRGMHANTHIHKVTQKKHRQPYTPTRGTLACTVVACTRICHMCIHLCAHTTIPPHSHSSSHKCHVHIRHWRPGVGMPWPLCHPPNFPRRHRTIWLPWSLLWGRLALAQAGLSRLVCQPCRPCLVLLPARPPRKPKLWCHSPEHVTTRPKSKAKRVLPLEATQLTSDSLGVVTCLGGIWHISFCFLGWCARLCQLADASSCRRRCRN
jgi:hypothetical protein